MGGQQKVSTLLQLLSCGIAGAILQYCPVRIRQTCPNHKPLARRFSITCTSTATRSRCKMCQDGAFLRKTCKQTCSEQTSNTIEPRNHTSCSHYDTDLPRVACRWSRICFRGSSSQRPCPVMTTALPRRRVRASSQAGMLLADESALPSNMI